MTETTARPAKSAQKKRVARFMDRTEVAHYLGLKGVKSLSRLTLPEPDALIGKTKGWLPQTIDEWNAKRPGRGRWGPR